MRRLEFAMFAIAGVTALCVGARPAAAQTATPADSPSKPVSADRASPDVQAVRDELDRLRQEFEAIRRQYDDRLLVLEQRLSQIAGGPAVSPGSSATAVATPSTVQQPVASGSVGAAVPQDPAQPSAQPAPTPAVASSRTVFNPDTSVIGNFVAVGGENSMSAQPSLELGEVEAAFQAVVDPYARADFFLSASPDGLEIEEGFITFTSLPADLLLKAGKMRAQFGKMNTLHTHNVPTIDRPLVTTNLVGGEEGLSDSGFSLSKLIHNPFIYLEATGEVYAGTSEVFGTSQRSRLNYVARLRGYRDLSEDKNIDLGTSFAFGPTEALVPDEFLDPDGQAPLLNKRLIGVDATFRYRPLRRAIYQRLNLRTELIWSRQDLPDASSTTAFGVYGLGEYQFARRWYLGARFDHSGRVFDASLKDSGGSFFITFWPTEFSQVRTQYRHTRYAEGVNANEIMFQLNFSIGAHGAHAF